MEEMLKIKQAAKYLKCHPNTVRKHLTDWGFSQMPDSRVWRVKKSDLDLLLKGVNNDDRLALSVEEVTLCRSTNANKTVRGGLILQRQVDKELDALLAQL